MSVSTPGDEPALLCFKARQSGGIGRRRLTQIVGLRMDVASGFEPAKIGFAGRRLDDFGITRAKLEVSSPEASDNVFWNSQ